MLGFGRNGLERRLRLERPKAPPELADAIAAKVAPPSARHALASRLSFAASMTVLVVGLFASFGGIGYAATATHQTVATVKQIAVHHTLVVKHSSAGSQYNQPKPNVGTAPTTKPTSGVLGTKAAPKAVSGTLPFTGISLATTLALSLFLMGLGVMFRRRGRKSS